MAKEERKEFAVIDADGHVNESPSMFAFLDKKYYGRRPLALGFDSDTVYGQDNAVWLIDGKVYPKLIGKGGSVFRTPTLMESSKRKPVTIPAQELTDVEARLRDLDKLGIDRQVVYPSLFLTTVADDVKLEAALMRAYNSFMADACSKSSGRIRFAALVPIRDVEESIRELRRARGLGAAAVMLLGVVWDRCLGDEAMVPFYKEAAELDVPVSIHFGRGCPAINNAFDVAEGFFNSAVAPVLMGFHSIIASGVLEEFSTLRFAFLETGAQWVPYLIHQLRRSKKAAKDPAQHFREGRVYVACEADEDINYIVGCIGEDSIVAASDYPHGDPSAEEHMVEAIMSRGDVSLEVRKKILSTNPQRLYSL